MRHGAETKSDQSYTSMKLATENTYFSTTTTGTSKQSIFIDHQQQKGDFFSFRSGDDSVTGQKNKDILRKIISGLCN